jgi:hypothetical protein
VKSALRATRLRLPKTPAGVTFRIRVTSHVQLPSGADPGLAIDVLGVPVKRGAGPRSTRLSILGLKPEATVQDVRLPSGQSVAVPELKVSSLSLAISPTSALRRSESFERDSKASLRTGRARLARHRELQKDTPTDPINVKGGAGVR